MNNKSKLYVDASKLISVINNILPTYKGAPGCNFYGKNMVRKEDVITAIKVLSEPKNGG